MYTWIEPKEVATNEAPVEYIEGSNRPTKRFSRDGSRSRKKNREKFTPYNKDNRILRSLFKSLREILATKKVAKAFNPPTRMTGRGKNRDTTKELKSQIEEAVKSRQLAHLDHKELYVDCSKLIKGFLNVEQEVLFAPTFNYPIIYVRFQVPSYLLAEGLVY
nr:reverse transcriptase domain-containing protein [Tanacetum cinerariifolium]